jgi:hypothetical protein
MDQMSLVIPSIDAAERFLRHLQANGYPVTAAGWIKEYDTKDWYLFIASPKVEELGIRDAYYPLNTFFLQLPPTPWLELFRYTLIGATNPVAKDMAAYVSKASANGMSPIRFHGYRLGDLSVEGAYLFPLPVPAASS